MKKYIVFAALMFVAISTNNVINAYEYPVTNRSDRNLILQLVLKGTPEPFFVFTKSGQKAEFSWPWGSNAMGAYCFYGVNTVIVDDALYKKLKENNIIDKNDKIVDNAKTNKWLNDNKIPRKEAVRINPAPYNWCQDISFNLFYLNGPNGLWMEGHWGNDFTK